MFGVSFEWSKNIEKLKSLSPIERNSIVSLKTHTLTTEITTTIMEDDKFLGLGKKTDCREELKRNLETARKEKADMKIKESSSIFI